MKISNAESTKLDDEWSYADAIGSPINPNTGLPASKEEVMSLPAWEMDAILKQHKPDDRTWGWTEENSRMTPEEKQKLIDTHNNWWHTVSIGDNICTPGKVKNLYMSEWGLTPEIIKGKSFLDIGFRDGGYSFYAERSGASKVTGLDIEHSKGFEILKQIFNSKVNCVIKDIIDLKSEDLDGPYDVVLFAGVFYHMKFPFLSLHKVAELMDVGGILILESYICPDLSSHEKSKDIPLMKFLPKDELNKDTSNWYAPNLICLISMLETIGFEVTKNKMLHENRAVLHATKINNDTIKTLYTNIPEE
ncbi:MAG: DUF1698 domain-containing protein [Bacteroidetes bacterium]|nr:DUF1698 domain-containing protein [Bacteroidota bacterium]